ncbi:MAG: hypothetical protein ABEH38_01340 [Flavobacteriales bacterium]
MKGSYSVMEFSNELIPLSDRELDREYRKYKLMAYLQEIGRKFREKRLYPYLSELKRHYTELLSFKGKKEELANSFPRELSDIDLEEQRLAYRSVVKEDAFMEEMDRIVELSLPYLKEHLEKGEELRSSVMEHIEVKPVGLIPLHKREGFLLLSRTDELRAYRYRLNMIQDPSADRRYRDLRTLYLFSFQKIWSPERVKEELLREHQDLPNPAVFWIESDLMVPHIETLLPIAKQVLIRLLGKTDEDASAKKKDVR